VKHIKQNSVPTLRAKLIYILNPPHVYAGTLPPCVSNVQYKGSFPSENNTESCSLRPFDSIFFLRRTASRHYLGTSGFQYYPCSLLVNFGKHIVAIEVPTFVYTNYGLNIYVAKIKTLDAIWEKEIVMECRKHSLLQLITGVFCVTTLIVFYEFLWLNYSMWTILNVFLPFRSSSLTFIAHE